MMAAKIAPGMNRSFTAETWTNLIGKKYWYEAIDEANDLIEDEIETDIQGYDIDGSVVRMARENAENAGVGPSDPFSGACSERSETSKEVWIHYHESPIWRAVGRPGDTSTDLS